MASQANVVIADEASLSGACGIGSIIGLIVPTLVSAALTFQVSLDGTNFYDLYDEAGNEVVIPASTFNRAVAAPLELLEWKYVKVRSGTSAAAVNQTSGPITITLMLREPKAAGANR